MKLGSYAAAWPRGSLGQALGTSRRSKANPRKRPTLQHSNATP